MPASLATVDDLGVRLGLSFDDETDAARAQAILDDLSALARRHSRLTWLDDDGALEEVPADVVAVVLAAAQRQWNNPHGYVSETIGDYSYRIGDAADPTAGFTDAELSLLAGYRGKASPGLWTQPLTRGTELDTVYVPESTPGADPIPWLTGEQAAW